MKTAVIYYSDNNISENIKTICLRQLITVIPPGVELVQINQHPSAKRCVLNLYVNILCGINQTDADYIYLAEHDVLYPHDYFVPMTDHKPFDFVFQRPGCFLDEKGYHPRGNYPLSSLMGTRQAMSRFCAMQMQKIMSPEGIRTCEPSPDEWHIKTLQTDHPYIDIRHGKNFTGDRESSICIQQIVYWPDAAVMWKKLTGETV